MQISAPLYLGYDVRRRQEGGGPPPVSPEGSVQALEGRPEGHNQTSSDIAALATIETCKPQPRH